MITVSKSFFLVFAYLTNLSKLQKRMDIGIVFKVHLIPRAEAQLK